MIKRILTVTIILPVFIFTSGSVSLTDAGAMANQSQKSNVVALSDTLPDLVIEDITLSPAHPSLGDKVTFTVTVKNQGNGTASNFYVAYYIDDDHINSSTISSIDPGSTVTKTFSWTAQPGSHTVKVIADSSGKVTESNETNNEKTYLFSTLAPDLIIETITWLPEDASKGDTVSFIVAIKNQGSGRAGPSLVYFYIDGSSRGYQEVQRIDAGATVTKAFTWVTKAGPHDIKAIVDKASQVTESDETNNEKTITFSPLAPDLFIEAITWSPESPSKGDNITFTISITNQGSGRADYSRVAYYIDDILLNSDPVDPISPGATDNKTFWWIAKAGARDIKVVADYNQRVAESDETNNEKTIVFSTLLPDLIIESITLSPESPGTGDNVTFSVTIKNQGVGEAGSSRVYFYVGELVLDYQEVEEIAAGGTVTKTFLWIARAGSHTMEAVADYKESVMESDETNNKKTLTFGGALLPDLIIEDITWLPTNPSIGDEVTFMIIVKNQGGGKADYSYFDYYIDETYQASGYLGSISSNCTDNNTFTWTAEVGSHDIRAVADSNTRIEESDETNNEKTVIFSTFAPDLIIETITGLPASPSIGDKITFTVTVKNQGTERAGYSRVYFYIDGSPQGYQEITEIDAGATATKTFTWIAQAGLHTIKAIADKDYQIPESDEDNNEKETTFPIPDLIIETITWSPQNPLTGDEVTFTVTVKNQGSNRSGSSRIDLYVNNSAIGYQEVEELAAGTATTKTFTWTAQAALHDIKAVVDANNEVNEGDETNNEKSAAFSIIGPDLIIESITWTPESPSTGDNITFTVTISNQGSEKAGNSRTACYVDDTYLTSIYVSLMEPDATDKKLFAWTVQPGSHTVKAIADYSEKVTESNETNNEKTVTVSAPLPPSPGPEASPPSATPPTTPSVQPAPAPSPKKEIWPTMLFILAAFAVGGIVILAILRSRRQ